MQNDTVTLASALRSNQVVESRIYKHNPPLLQFRIEEPEGGSYTAVLLAFWRITNPEILDGRPIHDPAETDFSLFVVYGSIVAMEAKLGIPSADEAIKGLGFFSHRWIRIR